MRKASPPASQTGRGGKERRAIQYERTAGSQVKASYCLPGLETCRQGKGGPDPFSGRIGGGSAWPFPLTCHRGEGVGGGGGARRVAGIAAEVGGDAGN